MLACQIRRLEGEGDSLDVALVRPLYPDHAHQNPPEMLKNAGHHGVPGKR